MPGPSFEIPRVKKVIKVDSGKIVGVEGVHAARAPDGPLSRTSDVLLPGIGLMPATAGVDIEGAVALIRQCIVIVRRDGGDTVESERGPLPPPPLRKVPGIIAQNVCTRTKSITVLLANGLVVKGPVEPGVAEKVARRGGIFSRPSWRPECHLIWSVMRTRGGALWLVTRNVDQSGALPTQVQWSRVYNYAPPAFAEELYGKNNGKEKVEVWAWRAVRGTLPKGSPATRVSDYLAEATELPPASVMLRLFIHLSLRFVLGCGDTGFHNCLMAGVGLDYEDNRGFGDSSTADAPPIEALLRALAPAGKLGTSKWHSAIARDLVRAAPDVLAIVSACDTMDLQPAELARQKQLEGLLRAVVAVGL